MRCTDDWLMCLPSTFLSFELVCFSEPARSASSVSTTRVLVWYGATAPMIDNVLILVVLSPAALSLPPGVLAPMLASSA
jgi:hypothetical protein